MQAGERAALFPAVSPGYGSSGPNLHPQAHRASSWVQTCFLLLAEVVGTGVLALPYNFTKLGIPLGVGLLVVCSVLNLAAGWLLWRLQQSLPNVTTFSDVAVIVYGPRAQTLVGTLLLVTLFLVMGNYLLVFAFNLRDLFFRSGSCLVLVSLMAAGCLAVPSQLRTLHHIASVSLASTLAVIAVLTICLWESSSGCAWEYPQPPTVTWLNTASSLSAFVFASGGQMIYLEMISEMACPAHFPKTLMVSLSVLFLVYVGISVATYSCLGDTTPSFLIEVLKDSTLRDVASGLMAFHVAVSYTLHQQVLCRKFHGMFSLHVLNRASLVNHTKFTSAEFWNSQLHWFGITLAVLLGAWTVANTIPFFLDLVALIGSLTQSLLFYVVPAWLFWGHAAKFGTKPSLFDTVLVVTLVVFGLGVFFLGTFSTMREIVNKWENLSGPFSCK